MKNYENGKMKSGLEKFIEEEKSLSIRDQKKKRNHKNLQKEVAKLLKARKKNSDERY